VGPLELKLEAEEGAEEVEDQPEEEPVEEDEPLDPGPEKDVVTAPGRLAVAEVLWPDLVEIVVVRKVLLGGMAVELRIG
jgi:hypothetical protein